jgi:hypothetical protein
VAAGKAVGVDVVCLTDLPLNFMNKKIRITNITIAIKTTVFLGRALFGLPGIKVCGIS